MHKILPRNDTIYTDIANFEDYEYTYCTAYEMAIRNREVQKLIFDIKKIEPLYDRNLEAESYPDEYYKMEQELAKQYFIDWTIFNTPSIERLLSSKYHSNSLSLLHEVIGISEDGKLITRENEEKTTIDYNKTFNFSRPKLRIPEEISREIDLKINLSLPKKELLAYMQKIKDDYDKKNFTVKNPLEQLGQVFNLSDKKIKSKVMADCFFVYDYVQTRQVNIDLLNKEIYETYKEEQNNIKSNSYLTGKDKNIQLEELKFEFKKNTIQYPSLDNTKDNSFFNEEEFLMSNITPGSGKNYFYFIKPFIEDLKYKELISGIKN